MSSNSGTKNLFCGELIGLKAKIVSSTDPERVGALGKIVDETMNTFVLETKNAEKTVPKKEVAIKFFFGKKPVIIDCKKLIFRPEDRIKALVGKKID